jgi:hypothetical protein
MTETTKQAQRRYANRAPAPRSLKFRTRDLLMFPTTVALIRMQELARRAAGRNGPWTLTASGEVTAREAGDLYNAAASAALGQLIIMPHPVHRQMLRSLTAFCAQSRSLDGLIPLFASTWSAVVRAGGIDDARTSAGLWDALIPQALLGKTSVPLVDLHGHAVLFYHAPALRQLRLSSLLEQALGNTPAANLGGNGQQGPGGGFNIPSGLGTGGFQFGGSENAGLGSTLLGGLSGAGTLPGTGFGFAGLEPGEAEDGMGFCQAFAATAGGQVGGYFGGSVGALKGVSGGEAGIIGNGIAGWFVGSVAGFKYGSDLGQSLCGGSTTTSSGTGDQLTPGTYVDPSTGYTYTVGADGKTTSGDTSGQTTGYQGDIDNPDNFLAPGTYTDPSTGYEYTVTADGHTVSGDTSSTDTPSIGEVDDPSFVSGGDKPQPEGTGGDKPQPDDPKGSEPNPDGSTGYKGPKGSGEKPNPEGDGGNPHSRGAVVQRSSTFVEGQAVTDNVVRVGASRFQLFNMPQLALAPNGALVVSSLGLLAARADVVAAAKTLNALAG